MRIVIKKEDNMFVIDPIDLPGSPRVGRGRTMMEAYGDFLIGYQKELGLDIIVDQTVVPIEQKRRFRELAKR